MYSVGIDVGTTNCKICLFDLPKFDIISKYSFETPKIILENESNFDIKKLWEGIVKGLHSVSKSVSNIEEIKNIAVASIGEAGVLLDKNENIIGPAMTWYDTRTKKITEEVIKKTDKKKIYEITGLPAHSNYSLNKILWIKENIKEYKDDCKWLCIAEFIAYKLTGVKKSEYSLASRTMAFDIKNKEWSKCMLNEMSLNYNIFSEFVNSGENIGTIKSDIAKKIEFSKNTEVSIGGHDHMCGSAAAGLYGEQGILNSTGTTEGLLFLQKKERLEANFYEANLSNGIHVIEDLYTIYASLPSAGYVIEWFKKEFCVSDEEFEQIIEKLYLKIQHKDYVKKDKNIFIPHLRGSGPPKRSIGSKALIYGITENTKKEDLLLTIFESLCFELKNLLISIEKLIDYKFSSIKVIGSACKNKLWLKLKANILDREILAYEIDEAVSKGAVMLAALKNGYIKKLPSENKNLEIKKIETNSNLTEYYKIIFEDVYKPFYDLKMKIENEE